MATKPKPTLGELEPAPKALAGKKAGEPAIVRWVARNIDDPAPAPRDCPDPFAWTLLRACRDNPAFLVFFVEKLWAKLIPTRSQLDGGPTKGVDGKPTLELIDRILSMKAEAEGVPAAPAPTPIVDAFDAYDPKEDE